MRILQIQQQKSSIDYGIFDIAYATEILYGEKVKILHSILLQHLNSNWFVCS